MAEISSSSNEQSQGIEQINHAVTQMDKVTQENAALVEQSAAAAQALQDQAQRLNDSVSSFRLDDDASNATLICARAEQHAVRVEKEHSAVCGEAAEDDTRL